MSREFRNCEISYPLFLKFRGRQRVGRTHPSRRRGIVLVFPAELIFALLLAGPIPPELGDLRELQELWLNQNQLTGDLFFGGRFDLFT